MKTLYIPIDTTIFNVVECPKLIKRGDTLKLEIKVFTDGVLRDLTGQNIDIILQKSDGTLIQNTIDIANISNGVVTANLDVQATVVAGLVSGELQLSDESGQESTNTFTFEVNSSLADGVIEVSKDDINTLNQLKDLIATGEATITQYETHILAIANSIEAIEALGNIKSYIDINLTALQQENAEAVVNIPTLKTENDKAPNLTLNLKAENNEATTKISTLTTKNSEAVTNNNNLDNSISLAQTTKLALDTSKYDADALKIALDSSIVDANASKLAIDTSKAEADASKVAIDLSVQQANDFVAAHGDIIDLDNRVTANENSITQINADLSEKANQSDLDIANANISIATQQMNEKIPQKNILPSYQIYSLSNSKYNHFGLIHKLNNGVIAVFHREAINHVNSIGKIILRKSYDGGATFDYNIIVEDSYDNRFIGGLVLANGRFILIYGKSNVASTVTVLGIYMKYSDDNGNTWSSEEKIYVTNYNECIYGKAIELSDRILQPFYYVNSTNRVSYLQSFDGGLTWTKGTDIYNGTENVTECALQAVGNTIVAIIRNENKTLKLIKSDDLGNTWTIIGDLNFLGEYPVSPSLDYFENSSSRLFILLYYADRDGNYMKRRYCDFSNIADITKWSTAKNLYSIPDNSASGYISTLKYGNVFKLLFFRETSSTVANITITNDIIEDIPDYDSGWIAITNNTSYQLQHGLPTKPSKIKVILSNTNNGVIIDSSDTQRTPTIGTTTRVDNSYIYLGTGTDGIYQYFGGLPIVTTTITTGYARIMLWI